jgi:hypothetical protein
VTDPAVDIGDYCRRVEEHLGRVNEGQIIRIAGPAFELARGWALAGIPLSVVLHGIDRKAERHRAGRATRPLRLEFCEADVRETFERWRRAVGLPAAGGGAVEDGDQRANRDTDQPAGSGMADAAMTEETAAGGVRRRTSLAKHLSRAVDRLSRAAGRLDLPEAFRERLSERLDEVASLSDTARTARGEARAAIAERLPAIDQALVDDARAALAPETLARLEAEAEADLAAYRSRLSAEVWTRSVRRSADRLVREHLGLPTLSPDDF